MRSEIKALIGIAVVLGLIGSAQSYYSHHKPNKPQTQPVQKAQTNTTCTLRGQLPDPQCTPGSTNPAVTQANIGRTICVRGWTSTVRPAVSYTENLKRQQMTEYGFYDTISAHEEDHLIPLELGGNPTDPANLWPEPGASPNPKDSVENKLNKEVCAGQITLQQAQQEISRDWTTAQ